MQSHGIQYASEILTVIYKKESYLRNSHSYKINIFPSLKRNSFTSLFKCFEYERGFRFLNTHIRSEERTHAEFADFRPFLF